MKINGERSWSWRAVDDAGEVLDILVQRHRSADAAKRFFRNSHQPVRRRERDLQRFKSLRHAARFCSVFSTVCNEVRPGRHALSAPNYRTLMRRRWREWDVVSETTTFAVAA